jgi:hypothetical protein
VAVGARRSRTAKAGARRSRTAAAGAPLICGGGAPLRGWRWWGASSGMVAAEAPLQGRRWPGPSATATAIGDGGVLFDLNRVGERRRGLAH